MNLKFILPNGCFSALGFFESFENFFNTVKAQYDRFMSDETDLALFKNPSYLLKIGVLILVDDKRPLAALGFINRAIELDEGSGPVTAIACHYRALAKISTGKCIRNKQMQNEALEDLNEAVRLIEKRVIPTIHLVGQNHMATDLGRQCDLKKQLWQTILDKSREISEVRLVFNSHFCYRITHA